MWCFHVKWEELIETPVLKLLPILCPPAPCRQGSPQKLWASLNEAVSSCSALSFKSMSCVCVNYANTVDKFMVVGAVIQLPKKAHIKPTARQSRHVLTVVETSVSPSEVRQHSSLQSHAAEKEAEDEDLESTCYECVNLTPGLWQSKEPSNPNTALQPCTKGFSPTLKASHWSFTALKCWYCFLQDFRHAFNMKPPEVIIKKKIK